MGEPKTDRHYSRDRKRFDLTLADLTIDAVPDEILDLDEALQKLAGEDPVKAELVKLRFFGGMTRGEAADFLGISTTTGDRYWAGTRAFLYAEMHDQSDSEVTRSPNNRPGWGNPVRFGA